MADTEVVDVLDLFDVTCTFEEVLAKLRVRSIKQPE